MFNAFLEPCCPCGIGTNGNRLIAAVALPGTIPLASPKVTNYSIRRQQVARLSCGQNISRCPQSRIRDARQIYRDKLDRLPRTTAGFTTSALDGYGLRDSLLARPPGTVGLIIRFLFIGPRACSTLPS